LRDEFLFIGFRHRPASAPWFLAWHGAFVPITHFAFQFGVTVAHFFIAGSARNICAFGQFLCFGCIQRSNRGMINYRK
jgi:hypothetical protein